MFLRSKLGLPRTRYRTETNPVSKTGDVAVATRSGREAAPESRNFVPFWLISADVGRDEASTLSRRILGRTVAREAAAPGLPLPFGARCILTFFNRVTARMCFAPLPAA